ncbi:hypothetical protein, partial [Zemynaea arenosa]|uniref:hypothetical protein n=1 Tax=Zemynaea arenosa TaxID=2561931 RepID=UPI00142FADB7
TAARGAATPYNGQRAMDVMSPGAATRAEAGQRAADSAGRSAATTPPAQASSSQSARTLILEARRAIANGNYRTAINRMDVCITMMDPVPQECRTLRISAEYQQQSMERCLASGADWIGDHCE